MQRPFPALTPLQKVLPSLRENYNHFASVVPSLLRSVKWDGNYWLAASQERWHLGGIPRKKGGNPRKNPWNPCYVSCQFPASPGAFRPTAATSGASRSTPSTHRAPRPRSESKSSPILCLCPVYIPGRPLFAGGDHSVLMEMYVVKDTLC